MIQYLATQLEQAYDKISQNYFDTYIQKIETKIYRIVNSFEKEVNIWAAGLEDIIRGRFNHRLIDINKLEEAFEKLTKDAARKGLSPLYYGVGQFFKEEISAYRQGKKIFVSVHPPFVRKPLLNAYRRMDIPIMLNSKYMAKITTPNSILIMNEDFTRYTEMTEFEFSLCKQWTNITYCPKAQVLKKDVETSCLLSLYRIDNKLIAKNWKLVITKAR